MKSVSPSSASSQGFLRLWWQAFRPKTLSAAVVPVVVGTSLAANVDGRWSLIVALCAVTSALCIQVGTNLFNDVLDFKKGADKPDRLGPQRVTQAGLISAPRVWAAGWISFVMAVLFGLPLVWIGGWPILVIGLISLVCGYAYTGGPYPLAYRGWGEVFVVIFFGLVAVGGTYYLHTESWNVSALLAGLQVGLFATALIAINNYRDMDQDLKVAKRTLAARLGREFARREVMILFGAAFALQIFWWTWLGMKWAMLLPFFLVPMAAWVGWRVWSLPPSIGLNRELARASLIHSLFGATLSLGAYFS